MRFVVVGGGIAGVCCIEELCRLRAEDSIFLISASRVLKGVDKVVKITRNVEEFEVVERDLSSLAYPNLTVVNGSVVDLNTPDKELRLASGTVIPYDKLCICAGARPKSISTNPGVVTLRDTESIEAFANKLQSSRRIVLVGNGGIALELVGAVSGIEVVWVLKHGHIGDAFFDVDAAQFLLDQLPKTNAPGQSGTTTISLSPQPDSSTSSCTRSAQVHPATSSIKSSSSSTLGHAAGPKWTSSLPPANAPAHVVLEYSSQVEDMTCTKPEDAAPAEEWPLYVRLKNGKLYGADLVVSATGVEPATEWLGPVFTQAADGGLLVDRCFQTNVPDVYAAGDCCTVGWADDSPHWFQMRLWTQARLMGLFAAHNMVDMADELGVGFNFELFTHVTRFLGKKVVLLGLYNGQGLEKEPEEDVVMYSRVTDPPESSFVRVLLLRGRMQGAVLIGETDLEETCEHLILDQLDLSMYGPAILDPDMELEHLFD